VKKKKKKPSRYDSYVLPQNITQREKTKENLDAMNKRVIPGCMNMGYAYKQRRTKTNGPIYHKHF